MARGSREWSRWFVGYGSYREPNRTEPRTLKVRTVPNPNRTSRTVGTDVNKTERDRATPANDDGSNVPVVDLYGAGKVQRRVWRAFVASPDLELTTAELARWAYPKLAESPSRKHRWAIVRAAQRVAERVRRDRPGGVVFRALGSNAVANTASSAGNCESAQ